MANMYDFDNPDYPMVVTPDEIDGNRVVFYGMSDYAMKKANRWMIDTQTSIISFYYFPGKLTLYTKV